ncbi:MAG: hypothetical protein NT098_04565 [Candidatus Parcubacteria bacterium]|nr:hypothetical protein [Candidatus Parcubacteria bacterium]
MKKIHYIIIFILILIISLLFFFWPKQAVQKSISAFTGQKTENISESASLEKIPQIKEIIYTNEGFSPTVLSINTGDTVVFKNKSKKDFQPISDTKNKIPFIATSTLPKTGDYQFTFQTPGEYGYYDALNNAVFGVIVVN